MPASIIPVFQFLDWFCRKQCSHFCSGILQQLVVPFRFVKQAQFNRGLQVANLQERGDCQIANAEACKLQTCKNEVGSLSHHLFHQLDQRFSVQIFGDDVSLPIQYEIGGNRPDSQRFHQGRVVSLQMGSMGPAVCTILVNGFLPGIFAAVQGIADDLQPPAVVLFPQGHQYFPVFPAAGAAPGGPQVHNGQAFAQQGTQGCCVAGAHGQRNIRELVAFHHGQLRPVAFLAKLHCPGVIVVRSFPFFALRKEKFREPFVVIFRACPTEGNQRRQQVGSLLRKIHRSLLEFQQGRFFFQQLRFVVVVRAAVFPEGLKCPVPGIPQLQQSCIFRCGLQDGKTALELLRNSCHFEMVAVFPDDGKIIGRCQVVILQAVGKTFAFFLNGQYQQDRFRCIGHFRKNKPAVGLHDGRVEYLPGERGCHLVERAGLYKVHRICPNVTGGNLDAT